MDSCHHANKTFTNGLTILTEAVSPSAREAAIYLGTRTITKEADKCVIRYSNGPFHRPSFDTFSRSPRPSPISPPLPIFSSSLSMRTTILGSSQSFVDSRAESRIELLDIRYDLMCNWLYQQQLQKMWSTGCDYEGVVVRKMKDEYVCCPPELSNYSESLYEAAKQMRVKCAMTVNTRTTRLMLDLNDAPYVPLNHGLRLQVVEDMKLLPKCQRNQFAAFVQDPPVLVVWDDDPSHIIHRIQELENEMMRLIWKGNLPSENQETQSDIFVDFVDRAVHADDSESSSISARRPVLIQPSIVAATMIIMLVAQAAGWRNVAIEIKVDKLWSSLVFPIIGALQAWMGLFFFQTLPTCVAQILGPVRQLRKNSKFFSGKAPPRLSGLALPHVTVQCPVYKESLTTVIEPTVISLKAAIATYEMQGGTANILINDDGMQVIDEEQAQERRDFYDEHNIGWVARPKHNAKLKNNKGPFLRAGKFKKASNMNYALNVSIRIEEKLSTLQRPSEWTAERERVAYDEALEEVITEDAGKTWAAGNVRVGDYILLIDSDTRVPRDCLLDAVSEMETSPDVAILQFSSGVMNVTKSWFEKGITFFTHLVYTAIEFAVANGDVAPFVGHNAFLRWSAVQDVAYSDPKHPSYSIFWSENTVSEDFDIALRLQTSGYSVRLAAYADGGFKEGVSLTVYDELARWEKYAYGCSELIFHPLTEWIYKGPFTPLFRRFMLSSMPLHSKISIMAYVGTYFAIGSSWLLTILNYFLVGWYNGYLDHYYIDSFKIYFSTIVIFNFVGNFSLAILRYRTNEKKLVPALFENFKWVILLTTFLGGLSLHVSQAILCHLFSVDMSWGATSKEATSTSFFREIPIILRKFRFTFVFCLTMTVAMVVLSGIGPLQNVVPYEWQITKFTAIFPLSMMLACHAMLPLALNPGLMQFTF